MTEINITAQSLPTRCEICHQADFFDPIQNYCSRCANSQAKIASDAADALAHGKVTFNIEWQLADILRGSWSTLTRNLRICIFFGLIHALLCWLTSIILINSDDSTLKAKLISVGPIIVAWLFVPAVFYIINKRTFKSYQQAGNQTRFSFSHDGFEISMGKSFSHISWDIIKKAFETGYCFTLMNHTGHHYLIPKRQLNDQQIINLREILAIQLTNRAFLFNKSQPFYQQSAFCLAIYALLLLTGLTYSGYEGIKMHNQLVAGNAYRQGMELWNKTDYVHAEQFFQQSLQKETEDTTSCLNAIACCRMAVKDLAGAEKYFQAALQRTSNYAPAFEGLGDIAFTKKDYSTAINFYQQSLSLKDNIKVRFYLGQCYKNLHQNNEAIIQLNKVLELSPGSAYAKKSEKYLYQLTNEYCDINIDSDSDDE